MTRRTLPFAIAALACAVFAAAAVAYVSTSRPPVGRGLQRAPSASPFGYAEGVADKARAALATPAPVAAPLAEGATATIKPLAPKPAPAPSAAQPVAFDADRALAHVRKLASGIGERTGGTEGEWQAVAYARDYLQGLGYQVTVMPVPLPNGRTSHDVIAARRGATGPIVVLGGHIDTKSSPGADDNASGCGTVLELARDFAAAPTPADVRFVLFGNEELIGDGDSDHHHYGSRAYVRSLTGAERTRFAAAVSIDMIGYGPDFRVRTMGEGTRALADRLLATARTTGAPLAYLRDPGKPSGWSDHEAFERAGLPAAWLEWRDNDNAHTKRDTAERIDAGKVRTTGVLVHSWLRSLTAADLGALVRAR